MLRIKHVLPIIAVLVSFVDATRQHDAMVEVSPKNTVVETSRGLKGNKYINRSTSSTSSHEKTAPNKDADDEEVETLSVSSTKPIPDHKLSPCPTAKPTSSPAGSVNPDSNPEDPIAGSDPENSTPAASTSTTTSTVSSPTTTRTVASTKQSADSLTTTLTPAVDVVTTTTPTEAVISGVSTAQQSTTSPTTTQSPAGPISPTTTRTPVDTASQAPGGSGSSTTTQTPVDVVLTTTTPTVATTTDASTAQQNTISPTTTKPSAGSVSPTTTQASVDTAPIDVSTTSSIGSPAGSGSPTTTQTSVDTAPIDVSTTSSTDSPAGSVSSTTTQTPVDTAPIDVSTTSSTDASTRASSESPMESSTYSPFSSSTGSPTSQGTNSPKSTNSTVGDNTLCTTDKSGSYGDVSAADFYEIDYFFEMELVQSNQTFIEEVIIPGIEEAINEKLLPELFPEACEESRRLLASQEVRLPEARRLSILGISPAPRDQIAYGENCNSDTGEASSCFVTKGRMKLFETSGNTRELKAVILDTIKAGMEEDTIAKAAHDDIIKLYYIEEIAENPNSIESDLSAPVETFADGGSPTSVLVAAAAGTIAILGAILGWRKFRKNDDDDDDSDDSGTDFDGTQVDGNYRSNDEMMEDGSLI